MTEKRILIDENELKEIHNELKSRGLSIKGISNKICTRFDSALYYGYSISKESFQKLEVLYGKVINHTIIDSPVNINSSSKGGKQKIIYSEFSSQDLKNWVKFYEELKSFKSVREYLIKNKLKAPNKETIRRKIKNFLSETDYQKLVNPPIKLEKSVKIAELIGIILGDGMLAINWRDREKKNSYRFEICLNKIKEKDYVEYVKELLRDIFQIEPNIYIDKRNNGISLRLNKKSIVEALINLGLKTGNKKLNQVSVPAWIKKNNKFVIACLRGLLDTDGSIFLIGDAIKINFVNSSYHLVSDFLEMCQKIEVKTSNIHKTIRKTKKGKKVIGYDVQIGAKNQIKKFLDITQPMKWKFRKENFLKKNPNPFEYKSLSKL